MEMYFSLLLLLQFAVGLEVVAQQGETVILSCFAQNPGSLEDLQGEGRKINPEPFGEETSRADPQRPSFRGRDDFVPDETSKGNFSNLFKNVVKEEAGVYRCKVNTASRETVVETKTFGSDQTIFASAGEEVILNCSVDSHVQTHEIEEVTWQKTEGDVLVRLFQNKNNFTDASHVSYQGRAEFLTSEIPKGNFCLKLKGVRVEDKGEFICEVQPSNMSGRSIVVLQSTDFSILLGSVLVLFLAALLITVLFWFPTFDLLRKKVADNTGLMIQATLILCPNICMCVAFILWSKEDGKKQLWVWSHFLPLVFLDTIRAQYTVSVISLAFAHRLFPMLYATSEHFRPNSFDNIPNAWIIFEHIKTAIAVGTVVYFSGAVISAGYACQMHLTLALETCNIFLLAFCVHAIKEYFGLSLQIISVLPSLLMALMIVLSLHRYCFQGKPFKCLHIALSFMVILFSLIWLCIYTAITIAKRDSNRVWILSFEAFIFIIVCLAMIFQLHFCREEFSSKQRGKGYLCWTIVVVLSVVVLGTICLHYTAKIMDNQTVGTGYLALTILVHGLAATAIVKHSNHLADLLHIVIYMFGAVGLTVISSITLASELILKAGNAARSIEDLPVTVLPFETLFVSAWLALQIYDAWMKNKDRIKHNSEDGREAGPEILTEMEPLPANLDQST